MTAHEEDVVIVFRQAVEEELRRAQHGDPEEPVYIEGAPDAENLKRLARAHAELAHEVALLRTIILRLVSDPLDGADDSLEA